MPDGIFEGFMKWLLILSILGGIIHFINSDDPGETTSTSRASIVSGILSANDDHVLAINSDQVIFGWGNNQNKALGYTNFQTIPMPKPVSSKANWTYVDAGSSVSYAIADDGRLWRRPFNNPYSSACEGWNSPVQGEYRLLLTEGRWKKVQESNGLVTALDVDNGIWLWRDDISECDSEDVTQYGYAPKMSRLDSAEQWEDFCVQDEYVVAAAKDGSLWIQRQSSPPEPLSKIKSFTRIKRVVCGSQAIPVIAIDEKDTLWVFGSDGDLTDTELKRFSKDRWIDAASAGRFTLGIAVDGSLWQWDGHPYHPHKPTPLGDRSDTWVAIATGRNFASALNSRGEIFTIGRNDYDTLGNAGAQRESRELMPVASDQRWGFRNEKDAQ